MYLHDNSVCRDFRYEVREINSPLPYLCSNVKTITAQKLSIKKINSKLNLIAKTIQTNLENIKASLSTYYFLQLQNRYL